MLPAGTLPSRTFWSAPSFWLIALVIVAAQCLWIGGSAITNTALFPDTAEQFIWSQSLAGGYYKHPPLTTWLFAGALALFGPHPWVAGLLSGTCLAATGLVTWAIAARLLGRRLAFLCVLLWSLQQPFSLRAYLYNHNVPLVLCVALCVWAVLSASQQPLRTRTWLLAGMAAGLSMLVKYQALLPLLGIGWALWRSGALSRPGVVVGLLQAAGVAFLVFLPHGLWLVAKGAPTLAYVSQAVETLTAGARAHMLTAFIVLQLRTLLPALLCAGLWLAASRWARRRAGSINVADALVSDGVPAGELRAWIEGLVLVPIVLVLLASAFGGMHLQGQWGMQSLQFASIGIVAWLATRGLRLQASGAVAIAIAATVHIAGAALVVYLGLLHARAPESETHALQYGKAQVITDTILADWRKITPCPLGVIVGDSHLAGLVSAYSGTHPPVLEGGEFRKSPWIDAQKMREAGSVHIVVTVDQLPPGAIHEPHMTLPAIVWRRQMALVWGIVPPTVTCPAPQPGTR